MTSDTAPDGEAERYAAWWSLPAARRSLVLFTATSAWASASPAALEARYGANPATRYERTRPTLPQLLRITVGQPWRGDAEEMGPAPTDACNRDGACDGSCYTGPESVGDFMLERGILSDEDLDRFIDHAKRKRGQLPPITAAELRARAARRREEERDD